MLARISVMLRAAAVPQHFLQARAYTGVLGRQTYGCFQQFFHQWNLSVAGYGTVKALLHCSGPIILYKVARV